MKKERTFKLDIFELLAQLDKGNYSYWDKLTEEQRKAFAPLVVERWMSGTSDKRQVILLNEFVNPFVFALGKHPQLLMQLLIVASSKTPKRYYWLGVKSKQKRAESYRVVQEYFELSSKEVKSYALPPDEELLKMAEDLGWQKEEISKLQKEISK